MLCERDIVVKQNPEVSPWRDNWTATDGESRPAARSGVWMVHRHGWCPEAGVTDSHCGDAVSHERQVTLAVSADVTLGQAPDPAAVRAARGAITAHQASDPLAAPAVFARLREHLTRLPTSLGSGGRGISLLSGGTTRELNCPAHSGVVTQPWRRDVRRHAARREQFGRLEVAGRQAA